MGETIFHKRVEEVTTVFANDCHEPEIRILNIAKECGVNSSVTTLFWRYLSETRSDTGNKMDHYFVGGINLIKEVV